MNRRSPTSRSAFPSFDRKQVSLEHVRNSGTFSSAVADRVAQFYSWSSIVFVGFLTRIHDGKPLRLRPRPSASILNVKQNLPHFQKSGSVLAPHLELNELDARVTPCELHARYRLHGNKYLHGNMRWKTPTDNYSMLSFAPFYNFKIFVRNC